MLTLFGMSKHGFIPGMREKHYFEAEVSLRSMFSVKINAAPSEGIQNYKRIQWSNPSEDETTWELQDRLRDKYPSFVSFYLLKSWDEISCSGGDL